MLVDDTVAVLNSTKFPTFIIFYRSSCSAKNGNTENLLHSFFSFSDQTGSAARNEMPGLKFNISLIAFIV